jgi:transcriptional regulator with XRE-family HTH domain
MLLTADQLRAARALVRMDQLVLAQRANVSVETIKRLEGLEGRLASAKAGTLDKIRRALEVAGVEFTNGDSPGVKLKPLGSGDVVRLKKAARHHERTYGIKAEEIATVVQAKRIPGQAPGGHVQLRLPSGRVSAWLDAAHFERAGVIFVEENGDGPGVRLGKGKGKGR